MGDMDYIGGLRTYLRQVQAGKVEPVQSLLKPAPDDYPWKSYAHYLDEIQALRTGADQRVSPIGQVLLSLRGRDAVRWLLTVESLLSLGDSDSWQIARRRGAASSMSDQTRSMAGLGVG